MDKSVGSVLVDREVKAPTPSNEFPKTLILSVTACKMNGDFNRRKRNRCIVGTENNVPKGPLKSLSCCL